MQIANNNVIARVAAVVAGLGLVAMSFASFAPAAKAQSTTDLQAQIQALLAQIAALQGGSTTATASVTFTRDLTIGSTGADVTALQNWLIKGGYAIPAGATGYFGAQTAAALAKYQAANGITPAAGYFGPITRAKVNASAGTGGTGTGTGTGTSTGGLSGGEADVSGFEMSDEDSSGSEGEEEVEVATVEFDVDDADVRVERFELMVAAASTTLNQDPWDYFDRVSIWADGKEVADMDVDDRDAWDEEDDDQYRLALTNLDYVVEEGDTAELTVAFDIATSIDSADRDDQTFSFWIPEDGIRSVDGEGIQHYVGDDDDLSSASDEVTGFGFDEEESGDLEISEGDENPDSTTLIADADDESDEYTVFTFDIENNDEDVDSVITDLTIRVATSTGSTDSIEELIDSATLVVDGDEIDADVEDDADGVGGSLVFDDADIEIGGDETAEFELVVTLQGGAADASVIFSLANADVEAEGVDSGDDSDVSGSATSETHTIAQTGIIANGVSDDADANDTNTVGTFSITFEVEALEDDVYIYNGADQQAAVASTTGVTYNIYRGGSVVGATTSDSALLQSDADLTSNGFYLVREGQTEEFTLTVTLDPGAATSLYFVELESIYFDDANDGEGGNDSSDTLYTVPNESEFETNAVSLVP